MHRILQTVVGTAEGGHVDIGNAVTQRVNRYNQHLVSTVILTQQHLTNVIDAQANKAVAGCPSVRSTSAINLHTLFDLPDGLQAITQVFVTLEADTRSIARHTRGGFHVFCDNRRSIRIGSAASSLHRLNVGVHHAIDLHVGQHGRSDKSTGQSGGDQFLVHVVSPHRNFVWHRCCGVVRLYRRIHDNPIYQV